MDITQITDIDKLKSLGFDTISRLEVEQRNLQIINARIQALSQNPPEEAEVEDDSADE